MAIDTQFIQTRGAPYVHSDIYHFRADVANLQPRGTDTEGFAYVISGLSAIRDRLQQEANTFLQGRDWKEVSNELFGANDPILEAMLQVTRDPEFLEDILGETQLVWSDPQFQKSITDIMSNSINSILSQSSSLPDFAELLMKDAFQNGTKQKIKLNLNPALAALFQNTKRQYITNTQSSKMAIIKELKKLQQFNEDTIWNIFLSYFKKYCPKKYFTTTDNTLNQRLLEFRDDYFKPAIDKSKMRDPSNLAGWVGEDLKNAIWSFQGTGCSIITRFLNVGDATEEKVRNLVQTQWQKSIIVMKQGSGKQKSHSDWIFQNSDGYIVRAQDKNSSRLLELLEVEANRPQYLKVQDNIAYVTLKDKLSSFRYNAMSMTDFDELDYLIVNTAWFSRYNINQSNAKRGEGFSGNLTGIRELINRILAEDVSYFLGVNNISLDNLGKGANITFFVIDNTLLYPTYLMFDYIIKQLVQGQSEIASLQVSLDTQTYETKYGSAKAFFEAKQDAMTEPYMPPNYGLDVLNVGTTQGEAILNSIHIKRVNVQFDIKAVLTSAYQFQFIH